MKAVIVYLRFGFVLLAMLVLAACNTSDASGTFTPVASQPQPANLQDPTNQTALTSEEQLSSAQEATNTQLQQSDTPVGLVDPGSSGNVQVAALPTSKSVTFLPVTGAPQATVLQLSRSLNSSAQSEGLSVLAPAQPGSKYRVKGYFSALNDGSGTLLVYIWDVLDGSGKTVHRINGQERTGTVRTDPWLAISAVEIDRVANTTTSRLKAWIDTRPQ